jgi:hypothetical protein
MSPSVPHPSETFRAADPALQPLVEALNAELKKKPLDLPAIKAALITLLEFLTSPAGRTDANCRAVDGFFFHDDTWVDAHSLMLTTMFLRTWMLCTTPSRRHTSHRISIPLPSSSWRKRVTYDI